MENRVAKLVKYSFGPTSCLAAGLVEFELFIHELSRFPLPQAKIQSCHCQHAKQSQSFDKVNVQGHAFYHYTPFHYTSLYTLCGSFFKFNANLVMFTTINIYETILNKYYVHHITLE